MNRRRMLSSIHRRMARNEVSVAVHQDATTIQRMSIADLDRIGPRLVTTIPADQAEPSRCAYCGDLDNETHDSARCAINQENS